jgi:putative membrane-bound dehydrogenase-like protein
MHKHFILIFLSIVLFSCDIKTKEGFDRFPEGKTKEFITKEGINVKDKALDLSLFASEPDFANPTNMDIDHKGRIWICEAYNYRNDVNNVPYHKKGDRILILEDTNGDGKSDKTKVFYQGEDVNSALGIAVLGNKTIVSCSPNVFVFTDTNNDDIPDKKEVLFKTKAGLQSDHGLHTFVFGPDGKLYFNFGNFAEGLLDKNNQPIKDIYGVTITNERKPFQDGMAVRCNLEGTKFEVLGWNFRNDYELALDSYGRVWQSDNDDDGKRGNRINYVLPYGNYGYKDEITGADWRVERTNIEDSVYLRHWHQNDPGVVPNLHQTYAGSPTGMLIYEGDQLPKQYQNRLFLADAGTNEVNSYGINNVGAGYALNKTNVLDASQKDKWFRPADICTAPDGSVFVADWYDSGVGGHFIGDLDKGRIYRVSNGKKKYVSPKYDFNNLLSSIEALKSPNISTRYMAYQSLSGMKTKAESELYKLFKTGKNEHKARALWLLSKLNDKYTLEAAQNTEENIRATAVRIAASNVNFKEDFFVKMAADNSFQVKQVVATQLRNKTSVKTWLALAKSYKTGDRWFLEALGIAATNHWDEYLEKYIALNTNYAENQNVKDIIWRSRAITTSKYLSEIIKKSSPTQSLKYFRAFDFQPTENKNIALLDLLKTNPAADTKLLIFKHFDQASISQNVDFKNILPKVLTEIKNDKDFLTIVSKYEIKEQEPRLFNILYSTNDPEVIELTANTITQLFGSKPLKEVFDKKPFDQNKILKTIERIGMVDNETISKQLIMIFSNNNYPFKFREAAVLAMVGYHSDVKLWNLIKFNKLSRELIPAAKKVLAKTYHSDLKVQFEQKFGKPKEPIVKPLTAGFLTKTGNAEKGKEVFNMYCTSCHMINAKGIDYGPGLSQIGKKLTKENIYNSIVNPSQGISFGYEGYDINLTDGSSFQGIITSKTADNYMVKIPGQSEIVTYKKSQVKSTTQMSVSLMPAFPLQETEYINLLEYLGGLK